MKSKAKLLKSRRSSYRTSKNLLISFRYAFNGIKYTFENSRNFKIQVLFALFILIIGSILQLDKSDYLIHNHHYVPIPKDVIIHDLLTRAFLF